MAFYFVSRGKVQITNSVYCTKDKCLTQTSKPKWNCCLLLDVFYIR